MESEAHCDERGSLQHQSTRAMGTWELAAKLQGHSLLTQAAARRRQWAATSARGGARPPIWPARRARRGGTRGIRKVWLCVMCTWLRVAVSLFGLHSALLTNECRLHRRGFKHFKSRPR
eukprot:3922799-Pleurochrysis_carterae.AAC.1